MKYTSNNAKNNKGTNSTGNSKTSQKTSSSKKNKKKSKIKHKKALITLCIIVGVILVLAIVFIAYFCTYYHAVGAEEYMNSSDTVTVSETDFGYFFDGEGEEAALIFYPGARVEATAYTPLMIELAEEGIDCFLVEMPLRMAFFGKDKALDIVDSYDYDTWILSGHSLGGAMAANCAADNPDSFDGLLLLAAYPSKDLSGTDLWVISLYGSEDEVLDTDKLEEARDLMPEDYTEICIDGGNHSQFGSYGDQKGDGEASLSADAQRSITIDAVWNKVFMQSE